jgi:hypothetical protein
VVPPAIAIAVVVATRAAAPSISDAAAADTLAASNFEGVLEDDEEDDEEDDGSPSIHERVNGMPPDEPCASTAFAPRPLLANEDPTVNDTVAA